MGEIKRQYRTGADDRPQAGQEQRNPPANWEVRQKGNDFEVVQPRTPRPPAPQSEEKR